MIKGQSGQEITHRSSAFPTLTILCSASSKHFFFSDSLESTKGDLCRGQMGIMVSSQI